MSLQSLFRRRLSASMVVSLVALFVALGGVGWAAVTLPAGSVGTTQLRNASVTNSKIANGSVSNWKLAFGSVGPLKMQKGAIGSGQINANQVQARVTGTCSGSAGAVGSINSAGKVQCVSTPPQEFGTSSSTTVPLGSGSTAIASKTLPGGSSYLVLAYPHAQISGASGQQVQVDCTLSVSPSNGATLTRSLTVDLGSHAEAGTIPLVVAAPSAADSGAASVSCSDLYSSGPAPTVDMVTTINAIQTASNG